MNGMLIAQRGFGLHFMYVMVRGLQSMIVGIYGDTKKL